MDLAGGAVPERRALGEVAAHHHAQRPDRTPRVGPGVRVILPLLGLAGVLDVLLRLGEQVGHIRRLALDSGLAALLDHIVVNQWMAVGGEPSIDLGDLLKR